MAKVVPQFVALPPELLEISRNLIPIQKSTTWKGRVVDVGEGIRRKFNQFINVFKTGRWSVENQSLVKLTRDLKKIVQTSDKVSNELLNLGPGGIEADYTMRDQLKYRLFNMQEAVNIAITHSKDPQKFKNLKKELERADQANEFFLRREKVQLEGEPVVKKETFGLTKEEAKHKMLREKKGEAGLVKRKAVFEEIAKKGPAAAKRAATESRAAELSKTQRTKPGKISAERKKILEEKLRRKHEVEVPLLSKKAGETRFEQMERYPLYHPTRERPKGPAGRRPPTKKAEEI
jgi:hypothetical protein